MKGVVFCMPASGHLNPLLALVTELVKRGEELEFYCTARHRDAIEAAGARFHTLPVLEQFHTLDPSNGMFALGELQSKITLEGLPAFQSAVETRRPDYILHDTMTPWGRRTAETCGLRSVVTFPSFATLPENSLLPPVPVLLMAIGGPGKLPRNVELLQARRRLERLVAARHGVKPLRFTNLISNPSECNLVFTSEEFQLKRERLDARFHFVGANIAKRALAPDFPLDALSGKPVVYASLGTVFHSDLSFYRSAIKAFSGQGFTLVLSVGSRTDPAVLGDVPPDCIVRRHVPQLDVLERAALFVTHGGMNSASEAMLAGVPMLVAPQAADQFMVAGRIQALGLGRRLGRGDFAPERLRELGREVMGNDAMKEQVRRYGAFLRDAGGPERAADIMLEYVGARPRINPEKVPVAVAAASAG